MLKYKLNINFYNIKIIEMNFFNKYMERRVQQIKNEKVVDDSLKICKSECPNKISEYLFLSRKFKRDLTLDFSKRSFIEQISDHDSQLNHYDVIQEKIDINDYSCYKICNVFIPNSLDYMKNKLCEMKNENNNIK